MNGDDLEGQLYDSDSTQERNSGGAFVGKHHCEQHVEVVYGYLLDQRKQSGLVERNPECYFRVQESQVYKKWVNGTSIKKRCMQKKCLPSTHFKGTHRARNLDCFQLPDGIASMPVMKLMATTIKCPLP